MVMHHWVRLMLRHRTNWPTLQRALDSLVSSKMLLNILFSVVNLTFFLKKILIFYFRMASVATNSKALGCQRKWLWSVQQREIHLFKKIYILSPISHLSLSITHRSLSLTFSHLSLISSRRPWRATISSAPNSLFVDFVAAFSTHGHDCIRWRALLALSTCVDCSQ